MCSSDLGWPPWADQVHASGLNARPRARHDTARRQRRLPAMRGELGRGTWLVRRGRRRRTLKRLRHLLMVTGDDASINGARRRCGTECDGDKPRPSQRCGPRGRGRRGRGDAYSHREASWRVGEVGGGVWWPESRKKTARCSFGKSTMTTKIGHPSKRASARW